MEINYFLTYLIKIINLEIDINNFLFYLPIT